MVLLLLLIYYNYMIYYLFKYFYGYVCVLNKNSYRIENYIRDINCYIYFCYFVDKIEFKKDCEGYMGLL